MGYCMELLDSNIFISKDDVGKALAAIQALDPVRDGGGGGCSGPGGVETWFSWVSTGDYKEAKTLVDALRAWRWDADSDEDGNVVRLYFQGEKLGDDRILLSAIAPFVKTGGFVEMEGEDRARWKWSFKNGGMTEIAGRVSVSYDED
jgi:hypothetical protein